MNTGEKNKCFSELMNWGKAFDTPSYAHRVNQLLPLLNKEQILFLWNRGTSELNSDDHERQWFAEITLANISPYLPEDIRFSLISKLDVLSFSNREAKAVLLLHLSKDVKDDEKKKYQLAAWEAASQEYDSPVHNTSSVNAAGLTWAFNNEQSGKEYWLDIIIDQFDPICAKLIWQNYVNEAKSGKIFDTHAFVDKLQFLGKILPFDYLWQACFDCVHVYTSTSRTHKVAELINQLIKRMPANYITGTRKTIVEFIKTQETTFVLYAHPSKLADGLEKIFQE